MYSVTQIVPYDREKAVAYAQRWALDRNPAYFDYSGLGGDCTNFISQCIYEGCGVMNYTPTFGWYYYNGNNKSPAWTGVPYLYNFLMRKEASPGPFAEEVDVSKIEPGDIIQLAFESAGTYKHSLFVVEVGKPPSLLNVLINTHTIDRKEYPLIDYSWNRIRYLKILGVRK